jgi:hypothetical protein
MIFQRLLPLLRQSGLRHHTQVHHDGLVNRGLGRALSFKVAPVSKSGAAGVEPERRRFSCSWVPRFPWAA